MDDYTALLQELWELTDEPAQRVVGVEHLTDVVDEKCVAPPASHWPLDGSRGYRVLKRGRWWWARTGAIPGKDGHAARRQRLSQSRNCSTRATMCG